MRITICCFSGTGNTGRVTGAFARALEALGHTVSELSLDGVGNGLPDGIGREVKSCDLLGVAYPIHAFNAPANILRFARCLPAGEGRPAFILKTSGEPLRLNDVSSLKLIKLLRRRGYEVRSEYRYCMPYNILFRHSDGMTWRMLKTAESLIPLDAAELSQGVPRLPRSVPFGSLAAFLMRCEHWGGRLNGRLYSVTGECVRCGKCVRECPAGNIRMEKDGNIKFGGKCLMCMRCAQSCPKDAVKIGLFVNWKVNGAYSFQRPSSEEPEQRYNKLLTRAYERYFREAERRVDQAKESIT